MRPDAVSVVLIARNGARYLREAIQSVRASTVAPLEILLIDGGSTDETVAIAREEPLVQVMPQQSQGIPRAYNEGIAAARGEFIAFISCDDLWLEHKLARQVTYMRAHPQLDLTVTMVQHFLAEGAAIPAGFRPELLEQPIAGLLMETLMVRHRVFDKVGLFDPSFRVGEDTDWFARVKDAGIPMAVLPDVLVRKRVHGSNYSIRSPHNNTELLRALRHSLHRKRSASGTAG